MVSQTRSERQDKLNFYKTQHHIDTESQQPACSSRNSNQLFSFFVDRCTLILYLGNLPLPFSADVKFLISSCRTSAVRSVCCLLLLLCLGSENRTHETGRRLSNLSREDGGRNCFQTRSNNGGNGVTGAGGCCCWVSATATEIDKSVCWAVALSAVPGTTYMES